MSIISGSAAISTTGSSGFYDFPISQSLMFDGSSYLSRSQISGDNNKWTLSLWSKQSTIPGGILFAAGNSPRFILGPYLSSHQFAFLVYPSYPINAKTNAVFRDTTSWNHFVIAADTNQTSLTNGLKLYQNGQLLSFTGGSTYPSSGQTLPVNNASYSMYIGQDTQNANYFNGYMAEINFIDGSALTPTSFGETKNGVWIPKDPSGLTYGNNGFRLTFDPSNPTNDSSGKGNHWTANGF